MEVNRAWSFFILSFSLFFIFCSVGFSAILWWFFFGEIREFLALVFRSLGLQTIRSLICEVGLRRCSSRSCCCCCCCWWSATYSVCIRIFDVASHLFQRLDKTQVSLDLQSLIQTFLVWIETKTLGGFGFWLVAASLEIHGTRLDSTF